MRMKLRMLVLAAALILLPSAAHAGDLSTTAFSYQGRLIDDGQPANGPYAFLVMLTDGTGSQVFGTLCEDVVPVTNGLFTLQLDFGTDVGVPNRFLEISVENDGDCGDTSGFLQLAPRQPITPAPKAIHALSANDAVQAESAGLAEHAGFAGLAAAARQLDAPDGSPTSAVFVDNAGNVGIGTGSPASKLDISGGAGAITLRLVAQGVQMLFDGDDINGMNGLFLNRGSSQNVILATGGGNVGIGTSAPSEKLDVNGTMVITNQGNQANLLWLATERSWVFRQEGTGASTALKLESIGGGGNKSFVIQTTGGVGIGRNPTLNNLEVEGSASKTTSGSWLANSDAAIKTNVRTLTNALDVIAKLRPVAFRYTGDYQTKHPSVKDQDYYNYIAQEFREVFPEWVHDSGEDGLLQMDEYPAGVYAVAAIQELHAIVQDKSCEIDELIDRERSKSHRLTELEGQNAELQARLERLEAQLEARTVPQQAD